MQLPAAFHQVFMLFRRAEVSLYRFFIFYVSRFSFLNLDENSDLNGDSELDKCKSKIKFLSKFQWNLGIFLEFKFIQF